ncbi:MAG: MBL fold metallo-hydrolase [Desulfobacterales bacterium]|nr:MBL fold metallo-hydrolase [Desulfobacterales bacterium]
MRIHFIGTGDAFGSGGRGQTCIRIETASARVLLDCGATALEGMNRAGIATNTIDAVLVSHLHGDHFGGLPFFLLEAQLHSRRSRPLLIAGPPGVQARVRAAQEVLFPGSSGMVYRFRTDFVELPERRPVDICGLQVTAFPVTHASGAPSYALRLESGGRVFAYSGDAEWSESLPEAANGADLFVCEAYFFDKPMKYHLNYRTLLEHRSSLNCRRLLMTHMSTDLLARLPEVELETAADGLVVDL